MSNTGSIADRLLDKATTICFNNHNLCSQLSELFEKATTCVRAKRDAFSPEMCNGCVCKTQQMTNCMNCMNNLISQKYKREASLSSVFSITPQAAFGGGGGSRSTCLAGGGAGIRLPPGPSTNLILFGGGTTTPMPGRIRLSDLSCSDRACKESSEG